jgi:protein SCO1/2
MFLSFIVTALIYPVLISAEDEPVIEVGIEEKLGEYVPLDISFFDEHGKTIQLKEIVNGKPTIIAIVYYRCPGICSPLLTGLAEVIDELDIEPLQDFNVITVSFDHNEGYIMASEKKKNYFNTMKKKLPYDAWRFLTADSINVIRLTDAVGWRFIPQGNDFMHGAAITVISPEGKIARYLYGTEFLPFDTKMAIVEASEGRVGSTITKVLEFCFSYDPEGRGYALNITRIAGAGVIFFIIIFVVFISIKKKSKNSKQNN